MFIHLGNKIIISDSVCIGIFNILTLLKSNDNAWIIRLININNKTVSIDIQSNIITSKVSSYTVIQRKQIYSDVFWRRINDKKL